MSLEGYPVVIVGVAAFSEVQYIGPLFVLYLKNQQDSCCTGTSFQARGCLSFQDVIVGSIYRLLLVLPATGYPLGIKIMVILYVLEV